MAKRRRFYVVQVKDKDMLFACLYDTDQGTLPAWTLEREGAIVFPDEPSAALEAMERWISGGYQVGWDIEVRVKA